MRPIASRLVGILGSNRFETTFAYVRDQEEVPLGCKTARLSVISAKMQALVMVKVLAVGLEIVGTHSDLLQRRLTMVARVVCNVASNRAFTIWAAKWSIVSIMLSRKREASQCTALSDTFWPQFYDSGKIDVTQLYKEAKLKEKILERKYCSSPERYIQIGKALYWTSFSLWEVIPVGPCVYADDEKYSCLRDRHLRKISVAKHPNIL